MEIIVQKYGGSSVATIDKLLNCAQNIKNTVQQGKKVIAVVSAMGKQTDELLGLAHQITKAPSQRELDINKWAHSFSLTKSCPQAKTNRRS